MNVISIYIRQGFDSIIFQSSQPQSPNHMLLQKTKYI